MELPQFIFVHIPKTGGGTFRQIIKTMYKDKYLQGIPKPKSLSYQYDVIAGHFGYIHTKDLPNYPLVTWVRDPVERVISHYFWAFYTEKGRFHIKMQQIAHFKSIPSISQFAELTQNQMTLYLTNNLQKYTFIGIQEQYASSLLRFQTCFNIQLPPVYTNKNIGVDKKSISDNDRKIIYQFNKIDYELYNYVLDMYGDKNE